MTGSRKKYKGKEQETFNDRGKEVGVPKIEWVQDIGCRLR